MKKKFFSVLGLAIVGCLSGCFLQMPETISVKTNANYNFVLGKINTSLEDSFSVKDMIPSDSNNSRIKIFDYNPDSASAKVQQYLIKMPIQEIPVNFSDYFKDSSIADDIKGMGVDKEIQIPVVKNTLTNKFDLSGLRTALNLAVTNNSSEITFSKITYNSGNLTIYCPGHTGTVSVVGGGNVIATAEINGGTANVSLSGRSLYRGMSYVFSDGSSASCTAVVDPSSDIKTASGVSMANASIPLSNSVDLGLSEKGIQSCTIKDGKILVGVNFPTSWKNTTVDFDISLSGEISASSHAVLSVATIDMAGKSIGPQSVTMTMNMRMNMSNSDISFTDKPSVITDIQLNSYQNITMALSGITTTINSNETMSKEFRDFIKSITTKESGLSGKYSSSLPSGNNIQILAKSNFFGLDSSGTLSAGANDSEIKILSPSTPKTITIKKSDGSGGEYSSMDFAVTVLFPGATRENPNIITLNDVDGGKSYSVKISLEPEVNWTQIEMYSASATQKDTINTGFSLGSIFGSVDNMLGSDFGLKASFSRMPVYLYFEKPDISSLSNVQFRGGYLDCFVGKTTNGSVTKAPGAIVESFLSSGGTLPFEAFPKMELKKEKEKKKENVLVTNLDSKAYSAKKDLAELINNVSGDKDSSLCIDYELEFTTGTAGDAFTITKEDFEQSSNGASSIAIYAAIVVPLEFKVTEEVNVNFMGLAGMNMDSDLFGRTEAPSESEDLQFFSAIQYAGVVYKTSKIPLSSDKPIQFKVNFSGEDDYNTLDINEGVILINAIDLTQTYPLIPKLYMVIPKSTMYIGRDMDFETTLSLTLQTNGLIPIYGGAK